MNCLKCFNCGKKRKNNKNGASSILKKLSIRMITSFFIFSLLLSYVPAFAADSSSLTIDDEVHYTIRGEVNYALDYARTDFAYEDGSGIHLNVTKRAKFSHLWGNTKAGPYNGRYILNFFLREFYTQIESVSVNGVRFEKEADGALWKVAINDTTFKSLLIGVITNHDVVIKLKNGASLNSLGLANVKISFTTVWVRGDGYAELGGYDNGFILIEIKDTDKDGLYDFVEDAIGSNKFDVDTDGDGVPDNVEVLTDNTSPVDATSYLVVAPILTTTQIEPDVDRIIFGSVPKTIYNDPANPTEQLVATNEEAGNVIVKAFLYVEGDTDYSDNEVRLETKIPFADLVDGNFELHVPANTFNDEDRIVVVAYAPNGKYPMISDKTVLVGTLKVTFKTNGGIWSDGTNEDKKADIINGTATQPEVPQRKGFIFLGWASTADAQAPETGILTNLTDPKDVYAVWKVIPSYIENKEQTVIDGKLIDDVVIVLGDPAATITVETDKLPNDVSYDENTKTISGVANVTDWEKEEEVRIYEIGVIIENSDGSKQTETVKITVLRDTDGDGQPDIEDEDDDNDGFTDIEEDDAGTDPKDPDSIPEALQDTGPNDDLPNAGDNTNIVVPLSLALISGLLILLIILKEKKEDKETILN